MARNARIRYPGVIYLATGPRKRVNLVPRRLLLAMIILVCGVAAQAGLFPKLMKQAPQELQSEYVLLARMEPGRTNEVFTNPPPFATIYSNRVVLADGTVRTIEGVIRVRQKGTNVYMVSFEGEASWAAVQCELAGANGITTHLRQDRRHINDRDVRVLRETVASADIGGIASSRFSS